MFATVSAMKLRTSIGDILNRVEYRGDRVVIERKGQPAAAVVSVEDLRRLEALEAEREVELFRLAKRAFEEDQPPIMTPAELVAEIERRRGESLDLGAYV